MADEFQVGDIIHHTYGGYYRILSIESNEVRLEQSHADPDRAKLRMSIPSLQTHFKVIQRSEPKSTVFKLARRG